MKEVIDKDTLMKGNGSSEFEIIYLIFTLILIIRKI